MPTVRAWKDLELHNWMFELAVERGESRFRSVKIEKGLYQPYSIRLWGPKNQKMPKMSAS